VGFFTLLADYFVQWDLHKVSMWYGICYYYLPFIVTGSKQKWTPINIELPKPSRGRKSWHAARRDQPQESNTEAGHSPSRAKDDAGYYRRRDAGSAAVRGSDLSPRKDRKDRRDVVDRERGSKENTRPSSASAKASGAPAKKGKRAEH